MDKGKEVSEWTYRFGSWCEILKDGEWYVSVRREEIAKEICDKFNRLCALEEREKKLTEELLKYANAMDKLYNENSCIKAVVKHFGIHHLPLTRELLTPNK